LTPDKQVTLTPPFSDDHCIAAVVITWWILGNAVRKADGFSRQKRARWPNPVVPLLYFPTAAHGLGAMRTGSGTRLLAGRVGVVLICAFYRGPSEMAVRHRRLIAHFGYGCRRWPARPLSPSGNGALR